jgi:hypothetical protein
VRSFLSTWSISLNCLSYRTYHGGSANGTIDTPCTPFMSHQSKHKPNGIAFSVASLTQRFTCLLRGFTSEATRTAQRALIGCFVIFNHVHFTNTGLGTIPSGINRFNFPRSSRQTIMTSNDILSSETLSKAGNLEIFDENRSKIKFSSFYTDKQTLVIFIRHFMCGNCMVHPLTRVSCLIWRNT